MNRSIRQKGVDNMEKKSNKTDTGPSKKNIAICAIVGLLFVFALWQFIIPKMYWEAGSCVIDKQISFGEKQIINECGHRLETEIYKQRGSSVQDANVTELLAISLDNRSIEDKFIISENASLRSKFTMLEISNTRSYQITPENFVFIAPEFEKTEGMTVSYLHSENKDHFMTVYFAKAFKGDKYNLRIVFDNRDAE